MHSPPRRYVSVNAMGTFTSVVIRGYGYVTKFSLLEYDDLEASSPAIGEAIQRDPRAQIISNMSPCSTRHYL